MLPLPITLELTLVYCRYRCAQEFILSYCRHRSHLSLARALPIRMHAGVHTLVLPSPITLELSSCTANTDVCRSLMLSYCRCLLHWSLARVPRHRCIQLVKSHIPPLSNLASCRGAYIQFPGLNLPITPYFTSNGSHTLLGIPRVLSSVAEPLKFHMFSFSPWYDPCLPEKSPTVCLLQLVAYLNEVFYTFQTHSLA